MKQRTVNFAPDTQPDSTAHHFTVRLSSTPRGARLARLLAVQQLDEWGFPHGCDLSERAALVVAELVANAITHGRLPGRDFQLHLVDTGTTLRIEISDARGEKLPAPVAALDRSAECGRGLIIVEALASRWGADPRPPSGKTIWVELDASARPPRSVSRQGR